MAVDDAARDGAEAYGPDGVVAFRETDRLAGQGLADVDAVLRPHRSLLPAGFYAVMAVVAAAAFTLGPAFFLLGAWPVVGFLGLEVALLWGAFRLSYRSGRLTETLELFPDSLRVRRVLPSGRAREWRFQPYWLRVEIDDTPYNDAPLTLTCHGRRLAIGSFLTAKERLEVGRALAVALVKLRCLPAPAPAPAG